MLVDMGFQYGKGFSEFDEVINELADEARELPVDKIMYYAICPIL